MERKAESRNDGKTPSPDGCRLRSPPVASVFGSIGRVTTLVPFPDLNFPPDSQPCAFFSTDAPPSLAENLEAEVNPSGSVSVNGVSPPPPPSSPFASKRCKRYGKFRGTSSNVRLIAAEPDNRNHQSLVVPPPPEYVASPAPTPRVQGSNNLARFDTQEREQQKRCRCEDCDDLMNGF
ncbi:unnamed protein product [Thlaspi arvense]|uniref:Uncharacterized protein n=1 Tax=Thlaspi arvense TaxID=13288 RepID=A0AAU9S749_THLAR|nr:unnamed protein product [Thlaspi arvense]